MRFAGLGVFVLLVLVLGACENQMRQALLPPPGFKGKADIGQEVFAKNCARCHGETARGTPMNGPPLINETYRSHHHPDLAFYRAVRDGVVQHHWHFGNMPAVENVSAKDVAHVIAYIRGEQRKAGIF